MRWYWDPSHFTAAAGDLIVARMFGNPTGLEVPSDFGEELAAADVEALLAGKRRARLAYVTHCPHEADHVASLVRSTAPLRERWAREAETASLSLR